MTTFRAGSTSYRFMYESEWILKALKRAVLRGIHNSAYIGKILGGWAARGGPDDGPEDDFDDELMPRKVQRAGRGAGSRLRAQDHSRGGWPVVEGRDGEDQSGDLRSK
jgi:hypothetical protein